MQAKRVLLMYITEVSGHHQATNAIENSIKAISPDSVTKNINGFKYVHPLMEKIINTAYMGVIKKTPKVWDYLYDNPKFFKKTESIKKAIHKLNHAKLAKLFNEFKPDAVVCSQAFPCGLVADYKISHKLPTKVIGVLTDYAPHRFWFHEGVDYYIVPSQDAKDRFEESGIEENRIKLFGIPFDQKFTEPLDKQKVAHKLGLDAKIPSVLIMGGGQGLGPIKRIVKSLHKLTIDFQLIVVAGTNKKLIKWLKKFHAKSCKKIIVYEYANNVHELMTVASLAITKPGGMTTTEALSKGLPMVIVNPIPGQEMGNTNFLLKQGAAILVRNLKTISTEIENLLCTPERLEKMRAAAHKNSKPNSSIDVAYLILK